MRFFLEFSYDGSHYHGWQIQPNATTVQAVLQDALNTVLRTNIEVTGAGRTDTGVHALQMFCHFDLEEEPESGQQLVYQLNSILPKDIAVYNLYPVDAESHSRFDAIVRTYHYHINQRKDPFAVNRSWFLPDELDTDHMNEACEKLKTFSDFSCFAKTGTQTKTNICKITAAQWTRMEEGRLLFVISADRFLRNMVRAIVGTMVEVGRGKMDLSAFEEVIRSGDRSKAGLSVPAHGLYLAEVIYAEELLKKK